MGGVAQGVGGVGGGTGVQPGVGVETGGAGVGVTTGLAGGVGGDAGAWLATAAGGSYGRGVAVATRPTAPRNSSRLRTAEVGDGDGDGEPPAPASAGACVGATGVVVCDAGATSVGGSAAGSCPVFAELERIPK